MTEVKKTKRSKKKRNVEGDVYNDKFSWLTETEIKILGEGGYFDDEGVLHNSEGCIRCTSMVRASGKRCKNFAIPGELYCRIHGGNLARAKRGTQRIYSAMIEDPTLRMVYENTMQNKEIAGLQEELALLRTLLAKIIGRARDFDFEVKEVKDIASIIGEIRHLLVDCTNAEVRLGKLISVEQVQTIVKQLANIIQRHVSDVSILERIASDFDRIIWPNNVTKPQENSE